jgi:hypothetical protein
MIKTARGAVVWAFGCVVLASCPVAAEIVYPGADGTLVDGGGFGVFDGIADAWDWTFNGASFEGAISLTTATPESSMEHRIVTEFDVAELNTPEPLAATLFFTIRGAPIFPFPDVTIHVYSYPADLVEDPGDYSAGPATYMGSATVAPYQSPTVFAIDVTEPLNEARTSGTDMVAFRFQIDPGTRNELNQAFIDALDSDPASKPYIEITTALQPGDFNEDGQVNLVDFALLANCFSLSAPNANCDAATLAATDMDGSGTVDLVDFATFALLFGS